MPDQPGFDSDGPDLDGQDSDSQDRAEIWDEDNQDTDEHRVLSADEELDFDLRPDVLDATRRVGDEDDDDALIGDDLDDDEIVELALDDEDEGYNDNDPSAEADEDDEADDDGAMRLGSDEVELVDAGDLNNSAGALGSAKRFESAHLSDEEIERLGYGPETRPEPRSFEAERDEAEAHAHRDAQLDEGVEATFPASDPVAGGHIT